MLLHGFPMYRVWWQPLFEYWNELLLSSIDAPSTSPMHVVACDLRGYSDGASPDDIEQYTYNVFAEDIFAIAESVFGVGVSFHLMGHDHGAALAWYSAAMDVNDRLESLVTLSVPHICLMSEALCGNHTDEDQVVASNYFNQFSLADSATLNDAALTAMFQSFGLPVASPEQFQKLLWWYHGSLASAISMPRVVSDQEVQAFAEKFGPEMAFFVQNTRQAIPMEERECVPGIYEKEELTIKISTLFIFGLNDFALLCNNPYATEFDPVLIPEYEHVSFECGHDFFLEGKLRNITRVARRYGQDHFLCPAGFACGTYHDRSPKHHQYRSNQCCEQHSSESGHFGRFHGLRIPRC